MSVDEIRKALRECPPGTFKFFSAGGSGLSEGNIQQHLENQAEVVRHLRAASEAGCAVEVIALRIQVIDFWLRILLTNNAPKEQRQLETGRLMKQCFQKAGLEKQLYDKLLRFNEQRKHAIHGFVVGTRSYQEIVVAASASDGLAGELIEFVVTNTGTVATPENFETEHRVGDRILNVAWALSETRAQRW